MSRWEFGCHKPRDHRKLSDGPGTHPPQRLEREHSPDGARSRTSCLQNLETVNRCCLSPHELPRAPCFLPPPARLVSLSVCQSAMAVSQSSQQGVASRPWPTDGTWNPSSRRTSHCGTRTPGEAQGGWLSRDSRRPLAGGATVWKRAPSLGIESLGLDIQFCHAAMTRVSVAATTRAPT